LSDQKYYVDLALNIVFESPESRKDDLIAKINECIQMMLEEEVSISFSSSLRRTSLLYVYRKYDRRRFQLILCRPYHILVDGPGNVFVPLFLVYLDA
jgi:hypothetical protein